MPKITKPLQILLIEDSLTDAVLLERVFTRMASARLQLQRVESLKQGLNCLAQDEFDLILLDLSLPDSWGLKSLEKIQNLTRKTPIIVLTGNDDDEIAIAAVREGAQDYLVKDNSINSELFALVLKRAISHAIERKQIMEQLRHSEALYRGAIEDQTEFICRFCPNGKISFVNQAFARYLAQTSAQLCRQNFFLLIGTEDLSLFSPRIANLSPENPNLKIEFRGYRQEELAWQQWNIRAIFHDREIVEYQAVGQDISDRKQAETEKIRLIASLQESQERFRVVTNSAPVLISMTDAKGKQIFVNQFWLDFTGKSLEQALIEDWLINVHPSDRQICQKLYLYGLEKRAYFDLEYRLLNHEQEYRWIFHTGVPRFNEKGHFMGFVCSGIDISQRKEAEKLLAQQATKNKILAEITQHIHQSLKLDWVLQTASKQVNNFLKAEAILVSKITASGKFKIMAEFLSESHNSCPISPIVRPELWHEPRNLASLEKGNVIVLDDFQGVKLPQLNLTEIKPTIKPISGELEQNLAVNSHFKPVFACTTILVPIIVEQKLWGVFCAEQCTQPRTWKTEEIELLEQITLQLAIAIKQAELYQTIEKNNQQLRELAVIDALTGIANRRKFDEYLNSEWKRLAREQAHLALIMCDIDCFKLYNDTYGHQEGDRCLQAVAQAIEKVIKRPADLTARYGGEEIAIVLPNTSLEGATKLAQDICQQVRALQIPHLNSTADEYVTLSLGVAGCVPDLNHSPGSLIEKADTHLYQAKKQGKNRVVSG